MVRSVLVPTTRHNIQRMVALKLYSVLHRSLQVSTVNVGLCALTRIEPSELI